MNVDDFVNSEELENHGNEGEARPLTDCWRDEGPFKLCKLVISRRALPLSSFPRPVIEGHDYVNKAVARQSRLLLGPCNAASACTAGARLFTIDR